MSTGRGFLDELSLLSRQQWLLRAAVPAATALMVLVQLAAGADAQPTFPILALVLSLLVALLPDSAAGLVLVVVLGGHWLFAVPEQTGPWLLVAALLLAAIHAAATLAAYGPPGLVLDRVLLALWSRRLALVTAATVATWLLTLLLARGDLPGGGWVFGAGLVLLGGWALHLARRLTDPVSLTSVGEGRQ